MMTAHSHQPHHHHHYHSQQQKQNWTSSSAEPIDYLDFFAQSYHYFARNVHSMVSDQSLPHKLRHDATILIQQIGLNDILLVTVLTFVLTIARHLMTKHIFQPLAERRGVNKSDADKIPESAWKLLFYFSTWTLLTYHICISEDTKYFNYPTRVWENYSIQNPVGLFAYSIYVYELSFYIHSLYTTLLVDQRRKDTYTLMIHHLICITLLIISYCNKSHKSGLLSLFFHDGCDILLEGTKLIRYFKVYAKFNGKKHDFTETFVNIGFGLFLLAWVSNRLYWFPMKHVFIASIFVEKQGIKVPFVFLLVTLLWIILLMNFYWFSFALKLLYKVATGQIKELEDEREYEMSDSKTSTQNAESKEPIKDRKLSVDSGVVMLADRGEESDDTSTTLGESVDEADQTKTNQESLPNSTIQPESSNGVMDSPGYNLRRRNGNANFQKFR